MNKLNRKIMIILASLLLISIMLTPLAVAKPWEYPKNNDKFEMFGVTIGFTFENLIAANYAATAGLDEANKVVVIYEEQPTAAYEIRIGEGASMRTYNIGEDFTYSGVGTVTTWNPILPYAFDPTNIPGTLFVPGDRQHFRVDYTYDFGEGDGGLDGTITMLALLTGNSVIFGGEVVMKITSLQGTGDFQNVNIQAAGVSGGHGGVVIGWPE